MGGGMKVLLDQGLPRSAARLLRARGFEAIHVADIGLSAAPDVVILERGRRDACLVVTLDADFHLLLALSRAALPSVIRIRMEGLRAEALTDLLEAVLKQCADDLEAGAAVTVQAKRMRVRRLPLIR
jgi:predicted nuclease of predicted toxin-antitoxin system